MSLDSSNRPSRSGSGQDLWPKWMWIAVPVLVVVVVAGLWWALLSPPEETLPTPTATPTARMIQQPQPSVGPTEFATLDASAAGENPATLPSTPSTFTPTPILPVVTPSAQPTEVPLAELMVGAKATVNAGAGLNMRSGAGTGHSRVKTLARGTVVEIVGGPQEADGYVWWQIRDDAGTTGWVASEFIDVQK